MSNKLRKMKRTKKDKSQKKLEKELEKLVMQIEARGMNAYLVMDNCFAKDVSLNDKIIIESMIPDIEEADPKSAFIHFHTS